MRYENTTLDDWHCETVGQKEIKQKCITALQNKKNLVLLGNTGTGKTMLAYALRNKFGGEVAVTSRMLRKIAEAAQGRSDETCDSLIKYASNAPLFIMDEFGIDVLTDAQFKYINEIIDARYMNELPTVFVSNMDFESFKSMVGIRVMDRLKGAEVLLFGWGSRR